ncbi:MAG: type II toxin-antitoxin system prevent-host-death family antitoxin [Nitrospirae bacterium]|nr:type II toxin-antitoxin system prevent-host-death family antitoxin [Nitrospirota bacterium]MBF0554564.1 type II toxin-antitoxin system prevent-host-death family antitoxin [Nitrospirota bacterium]
MEPKKNMTKIIDALSFRTHLGEIMEETEKKNIRYLVSRRGKPKMITLSVEDYLRNLVGEDELLVKIQSGAKELGLDKMTDEEIDSEILSYRKEQAK